MLSKTSPIDHNIGNVVPGDVIIVKFKTKEDESYKIRKSPTIGKDLKYKSVQINVDCHVHYESVNGRQKREKVVSTGLQSTYTSNDGSLKEHKMIFIVPGFDASRFLRSCVYMSTESVSSIISINDISVEVRKEKDIESENKLVFVSTWGIKCGIATYTKHLIDAIKNNKFEKEKIDIVDINDGINTEKIFAKLCHIQHEFGIMPLPPRISRNSKCLVTFHTIMTDQTEDGLNVDSLIEMGMGREVDDAIGGGGSGRGMGMEFTINRFENNLNIVGYIVHNEDSKKVLKKMTNKDIWIIPHGSFYIPNLGKLDARKMLEMDKMGYGIDINNDKIGFVFGFQSPNKNYSELIEIAKRTGLKLIISGAKHESSKYKWNAKNTNIIDSHIIFLDRFLTDLEVNLFSLASDILLFDYIEQDHHSVSGALHRIIGAGRPCITPNTNHFLDVKEFTDGILKFNNKDEFVEKIKTALDEKKAEELGKNARKYAERTLWDNIGKKHLEIYSKYVDFDDNKNEIKDNKNIDEKEDIEKREDV